jgi:succinoglycan biosynthesis transport protein ExoP
MAEDPRNQFLLPLEPPTSQAVAERFTVYQTVPESPESQEQAVPLSHYLWMLRRHAVALTTFVLLAVGATYVVSSRITPIYEATATLDVDRMVPNGVIGQDANSRASTANDTDQFLATQIEIIQSDSVLRPVAQRLRMGAIETGKPVEGSPRVAEAPIHFGNLRVTRPPKTFILRVSYRSPDPERAAQVANLVAESYRQHLFDIRYQASTDQTGFMAKQLDDLRAKMELSGAALSRFEKETDVISPEEKTNILSSRLVLLNTEYTNAQADRIRKEAAENSAKSGAFEALEVSTQGEQIRQFAQRVSEEREKFGLIQSQYGTNHPEYRKSAAHVAEMERQFDAMKANVARRVELEYKDAVNREDMLRSARDEVKGEYDSINARSYEYQTLKHDADADKTLYDELTRKIKEAGINASFQSSSVRMADPARPPLHPVYPRTGFSLMLAFMSSTLLGIGAIFISEKLDHSLRDPEQIQRQLQTEILGSLPVVKSWRGHLPNTADGAKHRPFFGSSSGAANAYEEAVRTLRDSILLPNSSRRPRNLLITSATPREGKTTTAVHLAIAHSQQKRRTLLIDADLRRPGVYHHVGLKNEAGLSNVINDGTPWRDLLITPNDLPHLSVLPAGPPSRRAADGIGEILRNILTDASADFDLVICDAPPLLGFAETLQLAALVDGVVVVALAGQTERAAVGSVLNNLKRLKANVIGIALNEVRTDMGERYYYYGYYGKYYSRYYKPLKD